MEEGSVTVLVDAKEEYTKQLISILKPCIYQGVKSIYMDAKDICNQDNTPDNTLIVFQDLLSRIPKWSQDIITKEYTRITNVSKCDYIDDLLKVVYVSHIKILTIVHSAQKNKKLSLKVPSGNHFIHLCYIECAREFWKDPYLFSDRVTKYEHQKNMRDSETMISECIAETIRKQLPVRHILKEFLNEPDEEIVEEDEDIKEPVNKKYLKKLETVVKKELNTTNKFADFDINLIRQVIREELNSRPDTNVIKKELVDTVVEKIVEKTQETTDDVLPIAESVLPGIAVVDAVVDAVLPVAESENIIAIDNITSDNSEKEKKNKLPSLESLLDDNNLDNIEIDTSDLDNYDNFITNTVKDTIKDSIVVEATKPAVVVAATSNVIDTKFESIKTEQPISPDTTKEKQIESSQPSQPSQPKNELVINNIDEVNLNLDLNFDEIEIDTGLEEEINLDDIKTSNTRNTNNNNKELKDPNTKYIFFNDANTK